MFFYKESFSGFPFFYAIDFVRLYCVLLDFPLRSFLVYLVLPNFQQARVAFETIPPYSIRTSYRFQILLIHIFIDCNRVAFRVFQSILTIGVCGHFFFFLQEKEALTVDERMTQVGECLAGLPVDITIGKMLLMGSLFHQVLVTVAYLDFLLANRFVRVPFVISSSAISIGLDLIALVLSLI